jgi:hypothetical protein
MRRSSVPVTRVLAPWPTAIWRVSRIFVFNPAGKGDYFIYLDLELEAVSYENRFPSEIAYIQTSIVDKHEKRLVKCWTDREHNWGIQGTSRGGGPHGLLKNELRASRGDIKDVVDKFQVILRRTNGEIQTSLSQESQKSVKRFEPSIFFRK